MDDLTIGTDGGITINTEDYIDPIASILRDVIMVITHARRSPMLISSEEAEAAMDRLLAIDLSVPSTND